MPERKKRKAGPSRKEKKRPDVETRLKTARGKNELEKSKNYFETVLSTMREPLVVLDADFHVVSANKAFCDTYGVKQGDVEGQVIFELGGIAWDLPALRERLGKVLTEGRMLDGFLVEHDFPVIGRRALLANASPMAEESDQFNRIVLTFSDVSDLKKSEEEVMSLSRFPSENPNVVMRISKEGNVVYCNRAGQLILDELELKIGQPVQSKWRQLVLDVLKSGTKEEVEEQYGTQTFLMMFSPIVDAGYVNVYGRDITERKKTEMALQQSEEKYRSIVETAQEGIMLAYPDGKIVFANERMAHVLGYTVEELTGKSGLELVSEEEMVRAQERMKNRQRGIKEHYEVLMRRKDGSEVYMLASGAPLFDTQGRHTGNLGMYTDITERKKAEEAMLKARDGLEMRVDERTRELSDASEKLQASFLYARSLIEASLDPLVTINAEGKITDVNKATEEATGFSREQLIGSDFSDYFTDSEEARKGYRRVFAEGFVRDYPLAIRHKSGRTTDVLYNATVYRNEVGEIQGVFAAARDMTERKKAEEELRRAHEELETRVEERTKDLTEATKELEAEVIERKQIEQALRESQSDLNRAQTVAKTGSWRLDVHRNELLWSGETYRMFGIPQGTPMSYETFLGTVHPDDREYVDKEWQAAMRGEPYDIEHRIVVDGEIKWVREKAELELNKDGVLLGGFGTVQDITERKRIENALKETSEYLDNLLNYANAPIIVWDPEFRITKFNHAFEHLSGHKAEEVLGKHLSVLFPEKSIEESLTEIQHTLAGEQWEVVEIPILRKDGNVRTVLWNSANIHAADGETLMATIAQGQDITERKLLEEKLFQSERKYRSLYETSMDGIVSVDLEGHITECNDAYAQMLGYSKDELKDMTFVQLTPEKWHQMEQEIIREHVIKRGHSDLYEKEYTRKDGSVVPISIRTWLVRDERWMPIGMWAIVRDVTRRKQLEDELKRYSEHLEHLVDERTKKLKDAERLATIGETAAMVGHDIRNPLQTVEGAIYLAKEEIKALPSRTREVNNIEEMLNAIHEETTYVNKIVSDLQDYARPLAPELEEIDTKQLINSALTTTQIPSTIEVSVTVDQDCCTLIADPTMMKRILSNLITNALQAMPNGGKLTIAAFTKQDEIRISVQDTGQGIPDENRAKIFQPLFSTKAKGQGFGLAVVKRLVEAHNGTITFVTEIGKGTAFMVAIPLAKEAD